VVFIELEVDQGNIQTFIQEWDSTLNHLTGWAGVRKAELHLPPAGPQVIKLAHY
jgi:hypothetical protein